MIEERADGWCVVLPYGDLDLVWPGYRTRALAEEVETRNIAELAWQAANPSISWSYNQDTARAPNYQPTHRVRKPKRRLPRAPESTPQPVGLPL